MLATYVLICYTLSVIDRSPVGTEVNGEKGNRCVRVTNGKRKSAEHITARRIMRLWDKDDKVLSDD